jgi:hypothetical protein
MRLLVTLVLEKNGEETASAFKHFRQKLDYHSNVANMPNLLVKLRRR